MDRLTLVLGGARSGKSARALALCPAPHAFIATAEPLDAEMAARIAAHRAERGPDWEAVEAPLELAAAVTAAARPGRHLLVDCLTLWLSNLLHHGRDPEAETAALLAALAAAPGAAVLVSNELGMGLAPMNALGRAFRDAQGRLNQRIAAAADRVEFVAAGLPLTLKGPPLP
ncbi:bifunctional adenosylcobinamide kinase/adenosylcobinamide-phosphate guanylyltransferase [Paralimibaculum aggregatum]|uniref:Bifunctional adenosylcobalamin biosynthesis protein n=1 Tax=Paralimibaculum aggregatum TaxID=3036245 RepID=A0ABQ6LF99_9RHOB|nr:bifunctional adenosylcobinamide kinase/adenosylcobinamide-phosphate guanylyltransferase [Limibaculum sp. NKW23]GMG81056.1 bifunctional adenosylcobinamide kinase/adenosylcobinamide-phosphate guanylyltransferase [Limibaculum sp. NKW23]